MQRILILIYTVATGIVAAASAIFQTPPALFLINFFAPEEGDSYSVTLVALLVWLMFLLPLLLFLFISSKLRKKVDTNISPDRTGIFVSRKKAFQSAAVGIPVFINGRKAGVVDNGGLRFFDAPAGAITVQVGVGRQASDKVQADIADKQQMRFEMEIAIDLLTAKCVLRKVQ